jgi:hypothetical protein
LVGGDNLHDAADTENKTAVDNGGATADKVSKISGDQ